MMMMKRNLTRRAFLGSSVLGAAAAAGVVAEVTVYRAGEGGYHTYRIPSLLATRRGTLLAFIEGRRDDARDHGDIDLLVKRSTDGGRTWSAQQVVHEEGGTAKVTIGNPCPVVDERSGTIWLPFCRDNHDVMMTSSVNDGVTWAKPRVITEALKKPDWTWYATGPGIGIQLRAGKHRGRLVIPCDHGAQVDGKLARFSHVFYSDDRGRSWQFGGSAAAHTNECQVIERRDGSLLLNMRNHMGRDGGRKDLGGQRAIATSVDGGATWSERVYDPALIEPVCQGSLFRYDARGTVLFSNPASAAARARMTVRLSRDEGRTWVASRLLYEGPAAYSSLARLADGSVGCLYERGREQYRETVTFARFPLAWLAEGAAAAAAG